jgi:hypothetical protein
MSRSITRKRWDWNPATQVLQFNAPVANFDLGAVPEFYYMRGFFITPAGANGAGPNRTVLDPAEADGYDLQVRVYNYSLRDTQLAGAARIKVRVYGQLIDPTDHALLGAAFPIGDAAIGDMRSPIMA